MEKDELVKNGRKVSNKELLALFDRFDNLKASQFVTETALVTLKNHIDWDLVLKQKIECINLFIKQIQNKMNMKYAKALNMGFVLHGSQHYYADPNMPSVLTKVNILTMNGKNIAPISLNIPLDKLISMPALEFYTILSAMTEIAIQSMDKGKANEFESVDIGKVREDKVLQVDEKLEETADKIVDKDKAHELLSKYLEYFLSETCGNEFERFENIASLVATDIISEMESDEIEKMLGIFFDFSQLNEEALRHVADFTGKEVAELREDCLFNKSQSLWNDPDKEPQALNITQQYQTLMSNRLKSQFSDLVKHQEDGFEGSVNVREFCKNYADTFMTSNGLKPILVTFKNEGELGTYIDSAKSQKININLSKITTVSELVSTLSHELTHAVESSINKSTGNQTKEGFGLADNISLDISKTTLTEGTKEHDLLKQLNKYCYRLNPNERSARYGELSALKLMQAIVSTEKEKQQLRDTIASFRSYQSTTLEVIANLKDEKFFADLEAQIQSVLASNIPESDKQLFIERLDYIKKMMANQIDLEASYESASLKEIEKFEMSEMEIAGAMSM